MKHTASTPPSLETKNRVVLPVQQKPTALDYSQHRHICWRVLFGEKQPYIEFGTNRKQCQDWPRQPKIVDEETRRNRDAMNKMAAKWNIRIQPTLHVPKTLSEPSSKEMPKPKRICLDLEIVSISTCVPLGACTPVPLSMAPTTPSPGAFSASFNDATGPIAGSLSFPGGPVLPSSPTAATPEAVLDTPSLEEPILANSKTGEELLEMADQIW
ncbi:hypothetical protein BDQ17DRAFT_1420732 [Cyathus striatus]|nr:hypothetical protein BDQ17DRAFT_1420732 [Cyathus striatus]